MSRAASFIRDQFGRWTAPQGASGTNRRLIVCLPRDSAEALSWAYFDGTVWHSGADVQGLDGRVRATVGAEVRVPAHDTLLIRLDLPTASRARIAQALPFALEEQLIGEPDEFEFAYQVLAPGRLAAAATARSTVEGWQRRLTDAGIRALSLVPQNLCLPWGPNEWSVAEDQGTLLVRTGQHEGFAWLHGGMAATEVLRAAWAEAVERPALLRIVRGPAETLLDATALDVPVTYVDWMPCQESAGPSLNLLAGLGVEADHPLWTALRPAAAVFGAWIVLGLLMQGIAWVRWHHLDAQQQQQMIALFERSFPGQSEVVDPPVQMRRALAALKQRSGVVGANDLLPLLDRVTRAVAGMQATTFRSFEFRENRLRLDVDVSGFAQLDRLKAVLRAHGLRVKVLNADSAPGGKVQGSLEVRSSA